MRIELFQPLQAEAVSQLIRRALLEINSQDYPTAFIDYLVAYFSPQQIVENAQTQHLFVALQEAEVIGTGGLANFGSAEIPNYYAVAMFVSLEWQGRGAGKLLMAAVEAQARALGAKKITVRSAVSARGFYRKLGYRFKDGLEQPDEKGNYLMEKEAQEFALAWQPPN
jgi:GNAT superfamily N-acetyltransferase